MRDRNIEPGHLTRTLTAALLAGGLSTRLGQDKAVLLIQGEPLWARQLSLLRDLNPVALWISARAKPGWLPPETDLILDTPPSRGPLSGITQALTCLQSSHLLALAVDLPRMTSEHLRKIVNLAGQESGVIPRTDRHLQPLAAVYPKQAAALARAALTSGDFSLHSFAGELLQRGLLREYPVPPEERGFYHNLNTPEDLRHA